MYSNLIGTFITSFIITFLTIPSIVKIAEIKKLFDEPDERKKHKRSVPTLGGMGIFAGLIFSLCFWIRAEDFHQMKYVMTSVLVMFFTGIKDDIVDLMPLKKLMAQLLAAFIIVYWGDIRISSMYGLFGIYEIPFYFSIFLSILVVVLLTNSLNLIDGVNMLAGSIGVVISSFFAVWFILSGYNSMGVLALSAIGSYLAFLYYNRTPAQIFMGDTGALLLGFMTSVLAIKFIEINRIGASDYYITSVPAVTFGVLIVPVFDTMRVFIKRIARGQSPLKADRSHIHHLLLDLGLSHVGVTTVLVLVNLLFIFFSLKFQTLKGEILLLFELVAAFVLVKILEYRLIRKHLNA